MVVEMTRILFFADRWLSRIKRKLGTSEKTHLYGILKYLSYFNKNCSYLRQVVIVSIEEGGLWCLTIFLLVKETTDP